MPIPTHSPSTLNRMKKELLTEYNHAIDVILEECEWKSDFTGKDVCNIVLGILSTKKVKTDLTFNRLYNLYSEKVESLKVTREEWVENYGVPEIIDIIYIILEENT